MDKLDRQIINFLLKDGQLPFSKIARELGVGTSTVIRRYNALKSEATIQRASITIDLKVCGFEQVIFFLVRLSPNTDAQKFFEKVSHLRNVIVVSHTVGDYDFLVQAISTDIEDFNAIVAIIQDLPEIEYFDLCIGRMIIQDFPAHAYYSKAFDQSITDNEQ